MTADGGWAIADAGGAAGWFGADGCGTLGRANDAASISCVRCGGGFTGAGTPGFDPGAADGERAAMAAAGFCRLGMSCVPATFFTGADPAAGGGGLVPPRDGMLGPVGDDAGGGAMRSPAAFWNAPRCESALLTASGETGGTGAVPSSGPGAPA